MCSVFVNDPLEAVECHRIFSFFTLATIQRQGASHFLLLTHCYDRLCDKYKCSVNSLYRVGAVYFSKSIHGAKQSFHTHIYATSTIVQN